MFLAEINRKRLLFVYKDKNGNDVWRQRTYIGS